MNESGQTPGEPAAPTRKTQDQDPSAAPALSPEERALQAKVGPSGGLGRALGLGQASAGAALRRVQPQGAPSLRDAGLTPWPAAGRTAAANVDKTRPATPPAKKSNGSANVDNAAAEPQPDAALNVDNDARPEGRGLAPAAAANVDKTPAAPANVDKADEIVALPDDMDEKPVPARLRALPRRVAPTVTKPSEAELAKHRAQAAAKLIERAEGDGLLIGTKGESARRIETARHYQDRGMQFLRRYRLQNGLSENARVDPIAFASFMIALRADVVPGTWRLYKQAALVVVQSMPDIDAAQKAVTMIESESRADANFDERYANKAAKARAESGEATRRTSQHKEKHLPYEDYVRLTAYIRHQLSSRKIFTFLAWLRAGIAVGLRPEEWRNTDITSYEDVTHPRGERIFLHVLSAKSGSGRSHGPTRCLEITDCSDESLEAIRLMSDKGREWALAGTFKTEQSQAAQLLLRCCAHLWPNRKTRHYALYSCRHQFVLNMRALNVADDELSAMLGHLVTESQFSHYGAKHKGWDIHRIVDRPHGTEEERGRLKQTVHNVQTNERIKKLIAGQKARRLVPEAAEGEDLDSVGVRLDMALEGALAPAGPSLSPDD